MKLVSFRTPKPKAFNYKPRYFDDKRDELERRKAKFGLESRLSRDEELRLQMSRRWGKGLEKEGKTLIAKVVAYLVYATFIFGTIYLIMFTNIIEDMLKAFGVTH